MDNTDTTPNTLGEESQLNSAPVTGAVGTESQGNSAPSASAAEALTLSELNQLLGKDYKDKGTALKSVKDTFSYVGAKKEDIAREIAQQSNTDGLAKEVQELREQMFFKDNPELKAHEALLKKIDPNVANAANSPEFQAIFSKAKGFDESQNLRTVLESNPRIAVSRDNLSKAKDAFQAGNTDLAESQIARAVLGLNN